MFQIGRESHFTHEGKVWVLSRLERRLLERFRDWIKEQIGDPFAAVKELMSVGLDMGIAKEMIAEAQSKKKQLEAFSMGCPLFLEFSSTELGQAELLYLQLLDQQPAVTREEAFQLWLAMGNAKYQEHLEVTAGKPPSEKNAVAPAA